MSSSVVDSGASSPPPLSATRSGSAAATTAAGTASSSIGASPFRGPPLQHVDPARVFAHHPSSSSSSAAAGASTSPGNGVVADLSSSYGDRRDAFRGHGLAENGPYKHPNGHWEVRTAGHMLSPRPEKLVSIMTSSLDDVAGAAAGTAAAAAAATTAAALHPLTAADVREGGDTALLASLTAAATYDSADSQQNRPSSSDPEVMAGAAGAATRDGWRSVGDDERDGRGHHGGWESPPREMNGAASYQVIPPPSPAEDATSTAAVRSVPKAKSLPFVTTTVSSPSHDTPSATPPQTRGLLSATPPAATRATTSPSTTPLTFALGSGSSSAAALGRGVNHTTTTTTTPVSGTRATAALGGWMPYTPPGPEPVVPHTSEGHATTATTTATSSMATTAGGGAGPAAGDAGSGTTLPPMALPVRSASATSLTTVSSSGPAKTASTSGTTRAAAGTAEQQTSPTSLSLTPSLAGETQPQHQRDNGDGLRLSTAAAAAGTTNEGCHSTQDEEVENQAEKAVAPEDATEHTRRVKRRPPSLFAASPVVASGSVTQSHVTRVATTASGSPPGKPPMLVPPTRTQRDSEAAAASARTSGDRRGVDGTTGGCSSHSSPLPFATRLDSAKLLQRQITLLTNNSVFSGNSYGCSNTPTSATAAAAGADYHDDAPRNPRLSSASYAAHPLSPSPSPSSTGLLTLISTTNGEEEEEEEEEDRGVGRVQDGEEEYISRPTTRHFSQPPTPQQTAQPRSVLAPALMSYSPPRVNRAAPLMVPGNAQRREPISAPTVNSQSSSLTTHSTFSGGCGGGCAHPTPHNSNSNNNRHHHVNSNSGGGMGGGGGGGFTMASSENSVSSLPTTSLHYGGSHAATAGRTSAASTNVLSPSTGSLGAVASHFGGGNSVTEAGGAASLGRAGSAGTPSYSSFASPPLTAATTNARGTRPPPLALPQTPATAFTSTSSSTTVPAPTHPSNATIATTTGEGAAAAASSSTTATIGGTGITGGSTNTETAAAGVVPSALPPAPGRPATRRRAPPPSLFKARSPVGQGAAGSGDVTSPKSAGPNSAAVRSSGGSLAGAALSTPPLHARVPVATMSVSTFSESTAVSSPGGHRTLGVPVSASAAVTPNTNPNGTALMSAAVMTGSTTNRPQSGSNALVRLSHDRRTLIAGMFRVSRDGCLTVRNMLLLNPTRIDVATNPPLTSSHGSPLNNEARLPVQLLHPQRTGVNYSPVSSNGGQMGRMPLLHNGQGPATPNTAGSDWCSPQMYGPATAGSAGFSRHGPGSGLRSTNLGGFDGGLNNMNNNLSNTNPNASFTLFSTSMDTPFSPITYSLDSQRFAFPSSSGYHLERGSGPPAPPSGLQLLRAAREDGHGGNSGNFNTSTSGGGGGGGLHDATPTANTMGNYLTVGAASPSGAVQAITPNSTTHNRFGGANGSLYRAQLRRQASSNWIAGSVGGPTPLTAASPTAVQMMGSVGSMGGGLGGGNGGLTSVGVMGGGAGGMAFNVPDTASSLLMPYADIPNWKGGMVAVGAQTSSNFVGSPATHTNPTAGGTGGGAGGGGGFTTTSTAGMNSSSTYPHNGAAAAGAGAAQLPPNVVRLPDLAILSNSVGEGASATVFVAIHKPTGRRLAVKRVDLSPLCLGCASPYLRSGGGSNGRIRQLQQIVIRELQVLHLTYRSPFMVKVYNAFFLPESAALDIVMEFMHYGSLDHLASALQKHARQLRETQQQRHRLLSDDDDGGGSPGSDGDGVVTSTPPQLAHGVPPQLHSPAVHALDAGAVMGARDKTRSPASATAAGGGAGLHRDSVSYLSPKLLNFGRTSDQQPGQLRGRRLGLQHHSGANAGHDAGLSSGAAGNGGGNGSTERQGGNGEDDHDSLHGDAFSVKSDCGTEDTELDDGSGLIEEPFGVTERLVAVVGEQLLRGVRDMHSRGYIHRDIKPGNVLVNEHGVVKLSDFGLSQRCDDSGTGIRNPAMTYVPPPSTMPTRSNTPMHSPSMSALQVGGWGQRQRSSIAFSPYAHRPLGAADSGAHHPLSIGINSPDIDASSDGLLLSSSITNSVAAQRDGMDVLDAESTSSSSTTSVEGQAGGRTGAPSSSSSDSVGDCSGTDKYMSPERQRGEAHGKPADIWAVGVTLAEFAVGEYPYNVDDIIDEFDRVSRLEKPVDVLQFNDHRAVPLSTLFADFIHIATLPVASQRPAAQELLEHPFFKQWHKPFNLKDYLAARVLVPSNQMKNDYLEKQRLEGAQ